VAGKITVGLASHWPRVTNFYPTGSWFKEGTAVLMGCGTIYLTMMLPFMVEGAQLMQRDHASMLCQLTSCQRLNNCTKIPLEKACNR